ncbi:transposase [Variovorax sp. UMC13]|uniref:DesA/ISL3 alpha bundle tail domain-containing protein n=1 Tax=Variovorax sp. UMC13 TaxID=1862326 RepID=UPI00217F2DF3|nr:transposase [Variovorax sp. UMC13]
MPSTFDQWRASRVAAEVSVATQVPAASLAAMRARRLAALLAHAAAHSPRYRRLLAGCDPATVRLEDLPVARKAELMRDFEGWVTDPALSLPALRRYVADPANIATDFLGHYTVWESSGSTGEPAIFVQDAQAMAVYDALEALRRPMLRPLDRLFDPWGLSERIASVGATDGHFASTVSVERLRRLQPWLAQRLVGISFLQPLPALCAELDAFGPTVVATYPSAAVLLAEERQAGRLKAAPREICTGGETLSAAGRAFVLQAFGCPVANSFGASEFLSLAFECPRGRLHLNSDWAILEAVDAHGRVLPPGGWLYIRTLQALGLATVKHVAPTPHLVAPKATVDLATVQAVIRCHYDVLASYTRSLKKACAAALGRLRDMSPQAARALKAAKPLLGKDQALLDPSRYRQVMQALKASQALATMYSMRGELTTVWSRSTASGEQLARHLQDWCQRAEASAIAPLAEFSRRLRSYA